MNENTMAQFNTEGQPAFPVENKENDNSADSPTGEETTTDQTPSPEEDKTKADDKDDSGKDDDFSKHPRWKEREEDWKKRFNDQETRHTEEIAKLREDLQNAIGDKSKVNNTAPTEIPSWFGGDEADWQEFLKWNEGQLSKTRADALNEIKSKSDAEQKAIDEATKYFNSEVEAIEADKALNPSAAKVDRNKLLKFVLDNDLVDSKGRWNYRAGYKLMQGESSTTKKDTIQQKKEVANATVSENRGEHKAPNFATSDDFSNPSNRPW